MVLTDSSKVADSEPENENVIVLNTEIPADVPEWVMVARVGRWAGHPQGLQLVTSEHLASAHDYFTSHTVELPIDYHHHSVLAVVGGVPKAPAAGWIKEAELRAGSTELWGRVKWNTDTAREIAAREFRYLSPVFRFNAPHPVSGEPVPMMIHSIALTNTPFLTELKSLNEAAATDGGGTSSPREPGDLPEEEESMTLFEALGTALGKQPDEVASSLGLGTGAEDKAVAEALVANATRVKELEAELAVPLIVNESIAAMLGVEKDADETAVKAAVIGLKAGGEVAPVRAKLGLKADAPLQEVLNSLDGLQEARHKVEAETLVDEAIKSGKIPPAQKDFFLSNALENIEATRLIINSLPILTAAMQGGPTPATGGPRALTAAEALVCKQAGLSPEEFLAAV